MSGRDVFWFFAGVLVTVAVTLMARVWLRAPAAAAKESRSQNPVPEKSAAAVVMAAASATPLSSSGSTVALDTGAGSNEPTRPLIASIVVPIAAAIALVGVALGIYFILGSPDSIASEQPDSPKSQSVVQGAAQIAADGHAEGMKSNTPAGSLDDVTSRLAARLAANGGSDADWNLLAQSYEYMGRTQEAQAARMHMASAGSANTNKAGAVAAANPGAEKDSADHADAGGAAMAKGAAHITGSVNVAAALAARAAAGSTLFIYAKAPDMPGPPLAVLRMRVDKWPVSFVLDDSNSMVPGRSLSTATTPVQLEARISRSGEAMPQTGDLVGSVKAVDPHAASAVTISIDHEIG